ncbi:MAG: XisI protein [Stigonema ocellatum SAG 48.90 = DSM 106950]|nr:XisI protein [Stigonema ocellatum SAG 48.90 = DSM 106950]
MDRLKHYRQIIQEVLTEYHHLNEKSGSQTESVLAFDEIHDQYLLLLMALSSSATIPQPNQNILIAFSGRIFMFSMSVGFAGEWMQLY